MSAQALGWALEQNIPRGPKLVLVSICNHTNVDDGYCWLKATTIAREASCTTRSVYNTIGALMRNGFIRRELRRSDDGKQRANDYWVLFDRDEKPWAWGADPEAPEADGEPSEIGSTKDDDATSCGQHETASCGENTEPSEAGDTRQPVEMHAVSPGPREVGFTQKGSAEPSKSNSKASSAGARVRDVALRHYRPPPPQPIAADTEHKSNPVFVYDETPAYDAWAKVEAARAGIRSWHLTTRAFIEGKDGKPSAWRSGWYFPTLFPPTETTGPPKKESALSESDMREFK